MRIVMCDNMITNSARMLKIDEKRIVTFFIFIFMFIFTEIGRKIYRPNIYSNDIFDYWIADTIGNFTGTIAIVFFNLTISNPEYRIGKYFSFLIAIGLVVYELLQYFSPRSVFDWRDIIATLIAGLISFLIYKWVNNKFVEIKKPQHKRKKRH
jgi:glycerol uptake facilitator-like aquaporin